MINKQAAVAKNASVLRSKTSPYYANNTSILRQQHLPPPPKTSPSSAKNLSQKKKARTSSGLAAFFATNDRRLRLFPIACGVSGMQPTSIDVAIYPDGKREIASPPAKPQVYTLGLDSRLSRTWNTKRPTRGNSLSTAISILVTYFPALGMTTRSPPAVHASFEDCCRFVTVPVEGLTKQVMFDVAAITPFPLEGTADVVVKA